MALPPTLFPQQILEGIFLFLFFFFTSHVFKKESSHLCQALNLKIHSRAGFEDGAADVHCI